MFFMFSVYSIIIKLFETTFSACISILFSYFDVTESRLNEHDGTQLRKYCKYLYFTITLLPNSGMNIGLNAFLAIANHLEKKEGNPPMPGSNFSYPSGKFASYQSAHLKLENRQSF